jgi:hypothetical protein
MAFQLQLARRIAAVPLTWDHIPRAEAAVSAAMAERSGQVPG